MKQAALRYLYGLFLTLVVLNACTGVAVKEPSPGNKTAYQDRIEELRQIPDWGFIGRISLDDGDRGGSGRLQWEVIADSSELDFHGAMGRGAWHLQISPEGAVLKEANGAEQTAAGVNELLQARMGWPIPVEALQWWVRGMAAPGVVEDERFDVDGLLINLEQFGWSIDFNRYDSAVGMALPVRLDARRADYRVKLAISRWHMDMSHASTD